MSESTFDTIVSGLKSGKIVPYIGPGALAGVTNRADGTPIPADSESLILAMNNGTPMAPKLMYEFPRAAMNLELKKGRKFVERFLTTTYGEKQYTASKLHDWLASLGLPYIIDINRDTQFQDYYQDRAHNLVLGVARISGTDYRFRIFQFTDGQYEEIDVENADPGLPILFKPMGSPRPEPTFIASDADYVDYITELMGGFSIPYFMKDYRKERQYLFLGINMTRDTERMVLSDIIYAADKPTGWALIPNPTEKELRFCKKKGIEVIDADWDSLISGSLDEKVSASAAG
ncbi:SIR2 family protein [Aurantivibrio plasticivorans]